MVCHCSLGIFKCRVIPATLNGCTTHKGWPSKCLNEFRGSLQNGYSHGSAPVVSIYIIVSLAVCLSYFFLLVGYVEERPWWPIQSPNKGRKKKASS